MLQAHPYNLIQNIKALNKLLLYALFPPYFKTCLCQHVCMVAHLFILAQLCMCRKFLYKINNKDRFTHFSNYPDQLSISDLLLTVLKHYKKKKKEDGGEEMGMGIGIDFYPCSSHSTFMRFPHCFFFFFILSYTVVCPPDTRFSVAVIGC